MSTARADRRVGQRHPTPGLTVRWHVPRKRRFRVREVVEEVSMVNVSASGAAIVGPEAPELVRHQIVGIECDGRRFLGAIERVVPAERPGVVYYGIQFVDPDADVIEMLLSHAGVEPRAVLEDYWRRAG